MTLADRAAPLVSFETEGDRLRVSDGLTNQSFSIGLSHPPTLDRLVPLSSRRRRLVHHDDAHDPARGEASPSKRYR